MSQSFGTQFALSFDGFCGSKDDPSNMGLLYTENRVIYTGYLVPDCGDNVAKRLTVKGRVQMTFR